MVKKSLQTVVFFFLCMNVYAQDNSTPMLIFPPDGYQAWEGEEIMFQWTPAFPIISQEMVYDFALFEVYEGQTVAQATRGNEPIFTIHFLTEPFVIWPEEIPKPEDGHCYGWTVSRSDFTGTTTGATWAPPSLICTTTRDPSGLCLAPILELDEAIPISLGMHINEKNLFLYPRALPIVAEGYDWDKVTFYCYGCAAQPSYREKAVRDRVTDYEWTLVSDKGSLGSPFQAQAIANAMADIEKIKQRIKEINDRLAEIDDELNNKIPDQINKANDRIKNANDALGKLDSSLNHWNQKLDSLNAAKGKLADKIKEMNEAEKPLQQQVENAKKQIDSLQDILDGKPSPEEISVMDEIASLQQQLKSLNDQLDAAAQQLVDLSVSFQQQSQQLSDALVAANNDYNQLKNTIESHNRKIAQLQTQLFINPLLANYLTSKADWTIKATQFIATYLSAQSSSLGTKINEVNNDAASVTYTSNQQQRSQQLATFHTALDALKTSLTQSCQQLTGTNSSECLNALSVVSSSADVYGAAMDTLSKSTALVNPAVQHQIDSLKNLIKQSEASLAQKENTLKQAEANNQNAIQQFTNNADALQQQKDRLTNSIESMNDSIGNKQEKLNDLVQNREDSLQRHMDEYLEQIHNLNEQVRVWDDSLERMDDSITHLVYDTMDCHSAISDTKAQIKTITDQKAIQQKIIDDAKALLDELEKKKAELQKEKDALNKELNDLMKELSNKQNAANQLFTGNKTAFGPLVYYIPPPLEAGLMDMGKFNELKKKVEEAEDTLKTAYLLKEALQGNLVKLIESIADALVDYKKNSDREEELDEEIASANKDLAEAKNSASLDLNKEKSKLQAAKTEDESKKKDLDEKLDKAREDSASIKKELDDMAKQTVQNDTLAEMLAMTNEGLVHMVELKLRIIDSLSDLIASKNADRFGIETNIKNFQSDVGRAQNDLTRATALEDAAATLSAQQKINSLDAQIKSDSSELISLKAEIQSLYDEIKQRINDVTPLQQQATDSKTSFNQTLKSYNELKSNFFDKNNAYKESLSEITLRNGELDEVEKDLESTEEKLGEMDDVNKQVNEDDSVKNLTEKVDELKKEQEKAKSNKEVATQKIEDAQTSKQKMIDEADKKLETAKQKLQEAQKNLNDFLHEQFKSVSFTGEIRLSAKDEVIDKYRSIDGKNEITGVFTYTNRVPDLQAPNADGTPPEEDKEEILCIPLITFDKKDPPTPEGGTSDLEPRTIALVYKNGEPLYDVWPIIPQENNTLTAKDVVPVSSSYKADKDKITYQCTIYSESTSETIGVMPGGTAQPQGNGNAPSETGGGNQPTEQGGGDNPTTQVRDNNEGGETESDIETTTTEDQPPQCKIVVPQEDSIIDLGTYSWTLARAVGTSVNDMHSVILWEPQKVPNPNRTQPQQIQCLYTASELASDDPQEVKSQPDVLAGVLTDVTDSIIGVSDTILEIHARVITGDHKGLGGEEIQWIAHLRKGDAKDFGFDNNSTTKSGTTDGDGLAKTKFHFGKGYAEFFIEVKWLRSGNVIQEDSTIAKSPLYIQMLRFSTASPDFAWKAALDVYKNGADAVNDELFKKYKFPDPEDEDYDKQWERIVDGVAGLYDHERTFINGQKVEFSLEGSGSIKPNSDSTKVIGIARTIISEMEEDAEATLTAKAEEKYRKVCRPEEAKKEYSSKKLEQFKIGNPNNPFLILLDEPATPGETVNGTGKLSVQVEGVSAGLISELMNVSLQISDVKLEEQSGEQVAVEGSVSYKAKSPLQFSIMNFEIKMDSFVVYAYKGAGVGGTVKHSSMENPVAFYAAVDPSGNFLGTLSELPAITIKGFKLKEGASITLDMHAQENPPDAIVPADFMGVYISKAEIELPESFKKKKEDDPYALKVEGFSIGSGGVSGSISFSGNLLSIAYAGYELGAKNISVTFKNSSIEEGSIEGALKLAAPMAGDVGVKITLSESSIGAEISTENPVYIPRLSMTLSLREGTGITFSTETNIGTLTINASMKSESMGDIDITNFKCSSDKKIQADNISVSKPIEFGKGFQLKINALSFLVSADEYKVSIDGEFGFKEMLTVAAKVTIKPGPEVEVEKMKLDFDKNPVTFSGEIEYKTDLFKGQFSIGIKMGSGVTKGISGLLIMGNQKIDPAGDQAFSYWYVELTYSGTPIPLGQSGVALMEVGGGVGYNFNPPIGTQEGAPNNNNSFSFKAIIGMGNVPSGELLAGRMEMVLITGQFSLYGKLWLLTQQANMFGEGQINLYWAPAAKLDGYIRMFVGLPNAKGEIFRFDGKINFSFPPNSANQYVWSDQLGGSVLNAINANGEIEVSTTQLKIAGTLSYKTNKSVDIGFATLNAAIDVKANGSFVYNNPSTSLNANAAFNGNWDVNLKTSLGDADLISGNVVLQLTLSATPAFVEVAGSANIAFAVWTYSGNYNLDVGYHQDL